MAYAGIERKRFAQLLELGADDGELRRFFADSRVQLIQKGARVQNLPHGKSNRIRVLTQGLPSATDKVVQKWFSENITMLDPEPISEAVSQLRLYEELGESPPEDEARRLSRTCLVQLFSTVPPPELMEFLRPATAELPADQPEAGEVLSSPVNGDQSGALSASLVSALIALEEGQDPDEQLSALPSETAALIACLYAIRAGKDADVQSALDGMEAHPEARELLSAYATRRANTRARAMETPVGVQVAKLAETDGSTEFDLDRDEVLAVCTKDSPDTQVFLQPLALRVGTSWMSLTDSDVRERIFWSSGNLMAFAGRHYPKQPRRRELGIWRVAKNEFAKPTDRTNFHICSDKTPVYEVHTVPFASSDYDSVREFIKHHAELGKPENARTTLFLLSDDLIVGLPLGKDASQDEGFEAGLPCWRVLHAFRIEGRLLVPGPLPPAETYECESLASSLRKLVAADKTTTDRLTRAQLKRLQELIASGEARLNAARSDRLRAELQLIDEHEGAKAVLRDAVMTQPSVSEEVNRRVEDRVSGLVAQKEDLLKSIEEQKRQLAVVTEARKRVEKDQRAMAPAVAKAIRAAFDRARHEAIETLGQVTVFKALMDETGERPATLPPGRELELSPRGSIASVVSSRRPRPSAAASVREMLEQLGLTPKCAAALQVVGELAHASGLVLLIEGRAARLAAEAWLAEAPYTGRVVECQIGLTDDSPFRELLTQETSGLAILDANLSPLDVYARPLIDAVQRRVVQPDTWIFGTRVVMSLSGGLAALPVPPVLESISLRVGLDGAFAFVSEADARDKLEAIAGLEDADLWFARLWRPAAGTVLSQLQSMSPADAALAVSVLDGRQAVN